MGLLGYYRKFIKDFAKITKPLTKQLKGNNKTITIDDEFTKTVDFCKILLTNDPILQYPDFTKPFILTTDASNFALGAVLSQGTLQNDKPVCFASRTLSDTEVNYSTIEKEMLAIIWAVQYYRPYLFGTKFTIVTDHKPLTWLMNFKQPNSKVIRWRLQLLEYDFEVVYKNGSQNVIADALSRSNANLNHNEIVPNSPYECPVSDKPLNDFNIQLVIKLSQDTGYNTSTPSKHKLRREYYRPLFQLEDIISVLKQSLKPNKLCAIFAPDDIFEIINKAYQMHFPTNGPFKIVRCLSFLPELTDDSEITRTIVDYHTKNNHRGIDETFLHLKRKIFFPYMKDKITKIIRTCETCLKLKYDRHPQKIPFQITETPLKPLDIVHIDIYTINNNYNLTIIDKFSKFAAAYPIPNRNCINVVKSLKHFISQFGIPRKLVYDQGAEFSSDMFSNFCSQYNIVLHVTSFQQSSSNSPVERLHSTFTEIYRIIIDTRKQLKLNTEHDETMSETLITYNSAIHSATEHTPFELFTGRTHTFENNTKFSNEHDYLVKLNEFKQKIYPLIADKLSEKALQRTLKINETRTPPATLEPETLVLRKENRKIITQSFTRPRPNPGYH